VRQSLIVSKKHGPIMDEFAFTFNEKIGRMRAGSIEMDEI
jgi:hypothetical protein